MSGSTQRAADLASRKAHGCGRRRTSAEEGSRKEREVTLACAFGAAPRAALPPQVHLTTPGCGQVHYRAIEPVMGGSTARARPGGARDPHVFVPSPTTSSLLHDLVTSPTASSLDPRL